MLQNSSHCSLLSSGLSDLASSCLLQPPDLSLLCAGGEEVRTHTRLLGMVSRSLGKLLLSPPSSSIAISLPDLTREGVERVLGLFLREGREEVRLGRKEKEVIQLLEIPIVMEEVRERVQVKNEPFVDKEVNRNISGSSEEEARLEEPKLTEECPVGPLCGLCKTVFSDRDDLLLHIGEVHSERAGLRGQLEASFTEGQCLQCGVRVEGEFRMMEHIVVRHPWPLLLRIVKDCDEDLGEEDEDEEGMEEDEEEREEDASDSSTEALGDDINNKLDSEAYGSLDFLLAEFDSQHSNQDTLNEDQKRSSVAAKENKGHFSCPRCAHSVIRLSNLKKHMQLAHNMNKEECKQWCKTNSYTVGRQFQKQQDLDNQPQNYVTNTNSQDTLAFREKIRKAFTEVGKTPKKAFTEAGKTPKKYFTKVEKTPNKDFTKVGKTPIKAFTEVGQTGKKSSKVKVAITAGLSYQCSFPNCTKSWTTATSSLNKLVKKKNLTRLVRFHMCLYHHPMEVAQELEVNFTGNNCNLCGVELLSKGPQKGHLINKHKLFDSLINIDVSFVMKKSVSIVGKKKRKRNMDKLKIKADAKSPTKEDSSCESIDDLRSYILFSDSDDDE